MEVLKREFQKKLNDPRTFLSTSPGYDSIMNEKTRSAVSDALAPDGLHTKSLVDGSVVGERRTLTPVRLIFKDSKGFQPEHRDAGEWAVNPKEGVKMELFDTGYRVPKQLKKKFRHDKKFRENMVNWSENTIKQIYGTKSPLLKKLAR